MKKNAILKNVLLGVLVLMIVVNAYAATYAPSEEAWTSLYYPDTVCSWTSPVHNIYAGNNVSGAGTNCEIPGLQIIARGFAYWKFVNITPATTIKFNCSTVGGPGGLGNGRPLLWRVFGNWSNETMTYNNQPAYCEGETCWNVIGGIQSNLGDALRNVSSANNAEWDLSSVYGFGNEPLDEIYLFFGDENTNSFSSYFFAGCFLKTEGLFEFSDVTVNVYDNFNAISGLEVQVCEPDYINCAYQTTDVNGIAEFNVPFGTYRIDAEYIIDVDTILTHSESFTADELNVSVNIYFDTIGPGSIGGFVYWPNGSAAPTALVYVNGTNNYNTVTQLDGQFLISPIVKGNYSIQAFKSGLQSYKETFSCTGDDSINLDLQAGIIPPDGYAYTFVNISVFEGVVTPLPGATVQRWSYSSQCPESCFIDSTCRNTNCAGDRHIINFDDRITNVNGLAIMNHISPVSLPLPVQFYIYAFKSGYLDDYRLVTITGNYTPVSLYLSMLPNTTVNLHETQNLQGVSLKVIPNMGATQTGVTNSSGDAQFTFTSVISSLIINATTTNPNYMNKNFIFSSLAGNPINKDFTLPYRNATSFNLYGFCIDNIGNLVDGVNIGLNCASCAGRMGNPTYCDEYSTQGGGMYVFTNIPKPATSNCFIHATPPAGYSLGDGHIKTFFPIAGDNYVNMTNCVRLIGLNLTVGTIYLEGYVIEGTGRKQSGLTISSGPFLYSINGSGYMDGMVSNGVLYIDELGEFSNVTIKFDIPDYEKRIFRIGMGNNNYIRTFTLDWIGVEETSTTEPTTTFPLVTTTEVTTTLISWDNYTIYTPSNETISLFDNVYFIVITVMSSICGFTTAGLTLISLFVFVCIILLGNQVLKALGFKWEWFGF